MLDVLTGSILPIFAILAIGFAMGRAGRATAAEARTVNRFAMAVPIPVLLVGLMAEAPLSDFEPLPVAAYALAEGSVFALGYLLARRVFGREPGEAVLLAFCGIFANNVFYVLPIARILHPGDPLLPIAAVVTLDSIVAFAGVMGALQILALGRISPGGIAGALGRSPALWAILVGLGLNIAGVALSEPVRAFIAFNGAAAAPAALWALGVILSGTPVRADGLVLSFTAIKVAGFPLALAGLLAVMAPGMGGERLYLLAAAGPTGAMAFSLALLFGIRTDAIAPVIVWTSLLTLVTLAALA